MKTNTYRTLEELYMDNRKLVFAFISDYSKEPSFMEEIASDVWIKVLEHDTIFLNMEKKGVKSYLRTMVKTTVSDYFRKKGRDEELVKRIEETINEINYIDENEKKIFMEEMQHYLRKTIDVLSEEDRLLIIMRFKNNKSAKETGLLLGTSESNVRVRQCRILAKMKKHIKMMMTEGSDMDGYKEN